MIAEPAFCGTCGQIFSPVRFGGNLRDVAPERGVPCPRCGAMAELPRRTVDLMDETLAFIGPDLDEDSLDRLSEALSRMRVAALLDDPAGELKRRVGFEGLSPTVQKVLTNYLDAIVRALLSHLRWEERNGRPGELTTADVIDAAEHALQHQRMFPR